MEKVTAYKSFNGKLFESEEKCAAYENKLSKYPKTREETYQSKQTFSFGQYMDVDIVKHIISVWEKPNSQRKDEIFYIVGGKYKFSGWRGLEEILMCGVSIDPKYPTGMKWNNIAVYFAEKILCGEELTDEIMNDGVKKANMVAEFTKYNVEVLTVESGKKWVIDNPAWKRGVLPPITFTIEKLC